MKSYQIYLLSACVIFSWWFFAFREKGESSPTRKIASKSYLATLDLPIDRDVLKRALDGDFSLMTRLIADWETDALALELEGKTSVKHLSKEDYVRAQVLGRRLTTATQDQIAEWEESFRLKYIVDDAGQGFPLETPYSRFLPQTYVSASFLLALTTPDSIIAIPKGLRTTPELYSPQLTDQIPLDIDRYCSEQLYHARPEIAFVSHYSHPATIQALQNQGVKLFTLSAIDTLSDIQNALIRIGNVINRPLEAELMALFMESVFNAVDNALLASKNEKERVLYVSHMNQFSLPSIKTLSGQLLNRLGVAWGPEPLLLNHAHEWSIPLDQEQIAHYEPDCIIIATAHEKETVQKVLETPAFSSLPAAQNARIFCVDETVQSFPSQYIALAYYDIAQALATPNTEAVSLPHTTASLP